MRQKWNVVYLSLLLSLFLGYWLFSAQSPLELESLCRSSAGQFYFQTLFFLMRLQSQQNSNNSPRIRFVFRLSSLCFLSSSIIEKQQTHLLKSLTSGHTTVNTTQGAGRTASKRICVRAGVCQQHIVCIKCCIKEICRPTRTMIVMLLTGKRCVLPLLLNPIISYS